MIRNVFLVALVVTCSSMLFAGNLGLSASLLSDESFGSIGYHSKVQDFSFGMSVSSTVSETSTTSTDQSAINMVLDYHFKQAIAKKLKLSYGLLFSLNSSDDIKSSTDYGVSLGLETPIIANLILSGHYFPVYIKATEWENGTTETQTLLGSVIQLRATHLLNL